MTATDRAAPLSILSLSTSLVLVCCGVVAGLLASLLTLPPKAEIPEPINDTSDAVYREDGKTAFDHLLQRYSGNDSDDTAPESRRAWVCDADAKRFDPAKPFYILPRLDNSPNSPLDISVDEIEIRGDRARARVHTIQWVDADYALSQGNSLVATAYFSRENNGEWKVCPSSKEGFS